jgi:hypothetical protein
MTITFPFFSNLAPEIHRSISNRKISLSSFGLPFRLVKYLIPFLSVSIRGERFCLPPLLAPHFVS